MGVEGGIHLWRRADVESVLPDWRDTLTALGIMTYEHNMLGEHVIMTYWGDNQYTYDPLGDAAEGDFEPWIAQRMSVWEKLRAAFLCQWMMDHREGTYEVWT